MFINAHKYLKIVDANCPYCSSKVKSIHSFRGALKSSCFENYFKNITTSQMLPWEFTSIYSE